MDCNIPMAAVWEEMNFIITNVKIFNFANATSYETGANIYVRESTWIVWHWQITFIRVGNRGLV